MASASDQPSITAAELARRLGGMLTGERTRVIRAVAPLGEAGPEAVSWVGSPEFLSQAAESNAGVLLVPEGASWPADRTIIVVPDPDAAICEALACLAPPVDFVEPGIHPSAIIGPGAEVAQAAIGANVFVGAGAVVGPGTQLHPGVYVGGNSTIGRDCVLWPNVVIRERVCIGDRVVIHPNATIGADGFGYLQRAGEQRKIPQIGTVVIEDDVEIGANSAIDRARSGATRIGKGTKIDNLVQVAHNVRVGEHCIVVGQTGIAGSVSLGHHVMVSGQVGIVDHLHVGDGARVAAKSEVTSNVAAGRVVRGIPATDSRRFLREQAALRKLPELIKRIREMERIIRQLAGEQE